MRIGAYIVHPGGIVRRSALRADENIAIAVLDPQKRAFPNFTRLITPVSHVDDR
jgi:hypothetical protein